MSKAVRGTVGIEQKNNKIRLRLPRAVAIGSQRYISTGLAATPENLKKAQIVAWTIEEDLRNDRFDTTLKKYKHQPSKVQKREVALDLITLWDSYCGFKKPQVAETTFKKQYLSRFANHIKKLPTKDLKQAIAIRDYLVANLSAREAKRTLTQLSACCKWAVKSGLLQTNPFAEMPSEIKLAKKDTDTIDPFTAAERDAILQAFKDHPAHNHYYSFVKFLFLTGCRTGEAIALQWGHVSQDCAYIIFAESYDSQLKIRKTTKTGRVRKFPCNAVLRDLLLSIRPAASYQLDDLVFTSQQGCPIDNHNFTNRVWKGCREGSRVYLGIVTQLVKEGKVDRYRCPYNTRHTFITMALEAGLTVPQVAKLVGNSPEVTMRHYAGSLLKTEIPIF